MTSDDYYEILGVSRDASDKEIKSAYKKAARKFHPDNKDTGNEELFKKTAEAYEVLSNPNKRTIYDQYGAEGLKGAGGFGGGGFSGFQGAGGFEDLGDIFSSFFGQEMGGFGGFGGGSRSRRNAPRKGQDHAVDIEIDFLDPIESKDKKIKLNPLVDCSACDGKGTDKPEDIVTCSTCQGHGEVSTVQNTFLGQIRQTDTCPTCNGTGKMIKNPCKKCKGKGQRRETKEVEITLPAGIHDGAQIRLSGLGDAGVNGGPPGDIYLVIHIRDHKKFQRDKENVFSEIQIGFAEASLGGKVMAKTIRGETELKIKAGTQHGDVMTLKSEGMPKLNNPARNGDHYIQVSVKTPTHLSGEEKKLLEKFMSSRNGKDNDL